jgi:hypothetical protein
MKYLAILASFLVMLIGLQAAEPILNPSTLSQISISFEIKTNAQSYEGQFRRNLGLQLAKLEKDFSAEELAERSKEIASSLEIRRFVEKLVQQCPSIRQAKAKLGDRLEARFDENGNLASPRVTLKSGKLQAFGAIAAPDETPVADFADASLATPSLAPASSASPVTTLEEIQAKAQDSATQEPVAPTTQIEAPAPEAAPQAVFPPDQRLSLEEPAVESAPVTPSTPTLPTPTITEELPPVKVVKEVREIKIKRDLSFTETLSGWWHSFFDPIYNWFAWAFGSVKSLAIGFGNAVKSSAINTFAFLKTNWILILGIASVIAFGIEAFLARELIGRGIVVGAWIARAHLGKIVVGLCVLALGALGYIYAAQIGSVMMSALAWLKHNWLVSAFWTGGAIVALVVVLYVRELRGYEDKYRWDKKLLRGFTSLPYRAKTLSLTGMLGFMLNPSLWFRGKEFQLP